MHVRDNSFGNTGPSGLIYIGSGIIVQGDHLSTVKTIIHDFAREIYGGNSLQYKLDRAKELTWTLRRTDKSDPAGIEPLFVGHPARSLIAILPDDGSRSPTKNAIFTRTSIRHAVSK
jgi:hypothetical protein